MDLNAPLSKINVYVRGGFIIPMQVPGPNLILGRGYPFQLLVAQSQSGDATGNLFWDDGDSIGMFRTFNHTHSLSIILNFLLLFRFNWKESI